METPGLGHFWLVMAWGAEVTKEVILQKGRSSETLHKGYWDSVTPYACQGWSLFSHKRVAIPIMWGKFYMEKKKCIFDP